MEISTIEPAINLVICLFKYNHNSELQIALDDETDIDLFIADGKRVAYVMSNYGSNFHDDYKHLTREAKETAKKVGNSTRGRKPKVVEEKYVAPNKGTGKEFSSAISFGVIDSEDPNKVYGIKLFVCHSGNMSGLKTDNPEKIRAIIATLLDYVNEFKPESHITYVSHVITLCNMKAKFNIGQGYAFNLFKVLKIHKEKYMGDYWAYPGYKETVILKFNNMTAYYLFLINYRNEDNIDRNYTIKLFYNGKINICGGNNSIICRFIADRFISMISDNIDFVLGISIPVRKQKEIV